VEPYVGVSTGDQRGPDAPAAASVRPPPRPHAGRRARRPPNGAGLPGDVLREPLELLVSPARAQLHERPHRRFVDTVTAAVSLSLGRVACTQSVSVSIVDLYGA